MEGGGSEEEDEDEQEEYNVMGTAAEGDESAPSVVVIKIKLLVYSYIPGRGSLGHSSVLAAHNSMPQIGLIGYLPRVLASRASCASVRPYSGLLAMLPHWNMRKEDQCGDRMSGLDTYQSSTSELEPVRVGMFMTFPSYEYFWAQ